MKTTVIGAGAWGTALARLVHVADGEVCLWGRDADALTKLASTGRNERYLSGVELPVDFLVRVAKTIDTVSYTHLTLPTICSV